MYKLIGIFAGVAVLAAAGAAPAARAGSGGGAGAPVHEVDARTVSLSPIVVNGRHVPMPVALQMIKAAVKRPWSSDPRDRNKLVCVFQHIFTSHFETMVCETNGQHFDRAARTRAALEEGESLSYDRNGESVSGLEVALERGYLQEDIGSFMNQHPMNRGAIMTILHDLPPANSSYTLRVMDHGKAVTEYVIKKGKVVAIRNLANVATGTRR